jgi:hypothetical protein
MTCAWSGAGVGDLRSRVRGPVDPDNMFHINHDIPPGVGGQAAAPADPPSTAGPR